MSGCGQDLRQVGNRVLTRGRAKWTTTPPTEPGWYWQRVDREYTHPVRVEEWMTAELEAIEYWPVRIEEPPND